MKALVTLASILFITLAGCKSAYQARVPEDDVYRQSVPNIKTKPVVVQPKPEFSKFTDQRDRKEYSIVKAGTQFWFAENLAFNPTNSQYYINNNDMDKYKFWVYNYDDSNLKKCGYLYEWFSAQNICPSGWHLPSKDEFKELLFYLKNEGQGFSLNKCGCKDVIPIFSPFKFSGMGLEDCFWSSERGGFFGPWSLIINQNGRDVSGNNKSLGMSVRCIKD
ncbi:MAG: hypothetical protein NTU44_12245 [Bacteroidetes bacterium]|nr:hypothetical protein [Bacteroidota bacterium]